MFNRQMKTPGFFDSFTIVSTFLDQLTQKLFGSSGSSAKSLLPGRVDPDVTVVERVKREDILLPSFGDAGEIVNDLANSILNAVTIWKHQ